MAKDIRESKYGKYICTELKKGVKMPGYKGPQVIGQGYRDGYRMPLEHVIWMDEEVIPGAFYVECVWFWPTDKEDKGSPEPHTHDYDEVLGFFGTDPSDLYDLGAVIELYIDGERNLMNETFLAFIPAGVIHNPLNILKITRPVFHFATANGRKYTGQG